MNANLHDRETEKIQKFLDAAALEYAWGHYFRLAVQQHPGRAGAICRAVQDGAGDAPLFSRRNIAILAAGSSVVAGNAAGTALIGFTAPVLAAWTGVIGTACLAAITVSAAHIALNKYTKRLMQEDMDNVRKVYLENVLNPQGVTPPAGWIAEPAAPAVPVSGPDEEPTHPIRLTPAVVVQAELVRHFNAAPQPDNDTSAEASPDTLKLPVAAKPSRPL